MLTKRGKYWYSDDRSDIPQKIQRYSKLNGYVAQHFAVATCSCGGQEVRLFLDVNEGAAIRHCTRCSTEHPIGDSADYLDEATLEECECPCGSDEFQIAVGVPLYENS